MVLDYSGCVDGTAATNELQKPRISTDYQAQAGNFNSQVKFSILWTCTTALRTTYVYVVIKRCISSQYKYVPQLE
jgi:hypothetical protein